MVLIGGGYPTNGSDWWGLYNLQTMALIVQPLVLDPAGCLLGIEQVDLLRQLLRHLQDRNIQ